jgi:hypothetical protein
MAGGAELVLDCDADDGGREEQPFQQSAHFVRNLWRQWLVGAKLKFRDAGFERNEIWHHRDRSDKQRVLDIWRDLFRPRLSATPHEALRSRWGHGQHADICGGPTDRDALSQASGERGSGNTTGPLIASPL